MDSRAAAQAKGHEIAIFGAGWFWGPEAEFRLVSGVIDTAVGYCGGRTGDPTYRQVCAGGTGHAEAVLVEFDPRQVRYEQLLDMFWGMHNPSAGRGMRGESESQYRSVIFTTTDEQARIAAESKEALEQSGRYPGGIATQIVPAPAFYRAEEYHQRYYEKKGIGACRLG